MKSIHHAAPAARRGPLLRLLALALVALGLGACESTGHEDTVGVGHGTFYARFSMQLDRGGLRSTNYRGGMGTQSIPVNTEVELVGRRGHVFEMRFPNGRPFVFEHVERHTMDSPNEAFSSFFAEAPIDLSRFSEAERAAIEAGRVEPGMSRDAVLVSIGPPPASGTLLLEGPSWRYWRNRFKTFVVHFGDDDRVVSIED